MTAKKASKKVDSNYILFKISYDVNIVLPHKEGMMLIDAFKLAERMRHNYGEAEVIIPLDKELEIIIISTEKYFEMKMNGLLLPDAGS